MTLKINIRQKIIISSTLILLLALIFSGSFFFFSYYKIKKADAYKEVELTITNVEDSIRSNFSSLNNMASNFLSTHYIREWMNENVSFSLNSPKDYAAVSDMRQEIMYTLIFNDAWQKKFIDTAYLFTEDQTIPLISRLNEREAATTLRHQNLYKQMQDYNIGTYFLPPTASDYHCYYIKKIRSISLKKDLTLIIAVNGENFGTSLYALPEDYIVHIHDKEGRVFFSRQTQQFGTPLEMSTDHFKKKNNLSYAQDIMLNKKPYINLDRNIKTTDFYISASLPKSYITHELFNSLYHYFMIMLLFILFFIVIAIIIVSKYTRIISDIMIQIHQIRLRNYTARMPSYKEAELNAISSTFNTMVEEFQELIDKVFKSELLLKEADIKLLQSQMNPHFLLNTLTTISTKALMSGEEELYEMVNALSNLLSASLYNKQDSLCKIQDELEYIKMYLYIQHIRFQDKLQYFITVEDEHLLEYMIPRLSVEPIVENAVIHGLEDNMENGIISLHIGTDDEDNIVFTIKDNGKGFDVEKTLRNSQITNKKRSHIGIYNTNKRLELIYGPSYGITFESTLNESTTAFIKIPKS